MTKGTGAYGRIVARAMGRARQRGGYSPADDIVTGAANVTECPGCDGQALIDACQVCGKPAPRPCKGRGCHGIAHPIRIPWYAEGAWYRDPWCARCKDKDAHGSDAQARREAQRERHLARVGVEPARVESAPKADTSWIVTALAGGIRPPVGEAWTVAVIGRPGTGKTVLLKQAALDLVGAGVPAQYVSEREIIARCKPGQGGRPSEYALAGVLVLDDLGYMAVRSQFARDTMVEIIESRHAARKPIVWATRLAGEDLKLVYGAHVVRKLMEGRAPWRVQKWDYLEGCAVEKPEAASKKS